MMPSPSSGKIDFFQINLHKSQGAHANLMAELQTGVQKHPKVILVQEPYFAKRQTPKAPQGFNIYYSQGTTPRAIILVSRSLTSIGLDHLSTRDTVLVQVTAGQEDFFVCSSYLDITVPHVVYDVDECVDHAHRTKLPIIIGMDSNCHSELWGCPNSNQRGEVLENSSSIRILSYTIKAISQHLWELLALQ